MYLHTSYSAPFPIVQWPSKSIVIVVVVVVVVVGGAEERIKK